jgi:hypothetical protein
MEISTDNLERVSQYVRDKRSGKMVEREKLGYTRDYLQLLVRTTQDELDDICKMFNLYVLTEEENMINYMGEIILVSGE